MKILSFFFSRRLWLSFSVEIKLTRGPNHLKALLCEPEEETFLKSREIPQISGIQHGVCLFQRTTKKSSFCNRI